MLVDKRRALMFAAALAAATPAAAATSGTASFLVVHGIPGRDVAETLDPSLPVDVQVNGSLCLLKGFTFGDIAGPYDVPTGTYTVSVSLANPISPCSGTPVITGSVTLTAGEFGAIVAQLSSSGAPTAGVYPIDVSAVAAGHERFIGVHAADAPAIALKYKSTLPTTGGEEFEIKLAPGANGEHTTATREAFRLGVSTGKVFLGPTIVSDVNDRSVTFSAIVGSAATGSVTILSKQLRNVH